MVALIPAEPEVEATGYCRLRPLMTSGGLDRLRALTESGHLKTCQVNKGGEQKALFWYRVEHERFIVDTIVGVGDDADAAFEAVELLARENGCRELEASTPRNAMVNRLTRAGWNAEKILLRKTIA